MALNKKVLILGGIVAIGIVAQIVLKTNKPSDNSISSEETASKNSESSPESKVDPANGSTDSVANAAAMKTKADAQTKPKPPGQVLTKDLVIGNTKIVTPGTRVSFDIVAQIEDGRVVFDSKKVNRPWTGTVGDGSLLPGIDRGIRGMLMGGKRALWIPPDLAYGENGIVGQIPPNSKIYAVIELHEVF